MVRFRHKIVAFPLAFLLSFSTVTPCLAVEDTASANAASAIEEQSVMPQTASSDLIPIERSADEINGEMVIVEVFEVPSSVDPNTLIKPNFEQGGYLYTENSIVKTPYQETKEKEVEMQFRDTTDTNDMAKNLSKLPDSMRYEVDGYVGDLYLSPKTISLTATAQKTKSSTQREVKTYNLEMNDPTQIPQSYNGLPLQNLTWAESGYLEDSSVPSGYIATATYSKTNSWKVDSAWELTATYQGTAVFENTDNIRYTVTYKGIEIPKGYIVENGKLVKAANPTLHIALLVGGILLLLALAAGAVLFLLWAIKHGLIYSRKIIVNAQNDETGEYSVIQKVRVSKKIPAFTLDTLKAPSSKHFQCEMAPQQAKVLRGKIINVTADGHIVAKHRVEPLNETDKYIFSVDLEAVDAGSIDQFSL